MATKIKKIKVTQVPSYYLPLWYYAETPVKSISVWDWMER